ncbi:hypothetical protein M3J09_005329 [Ascochyta lentis]
MRLPPDEYFPSRPWAATTNHRNVRQYFPVDVSAPKSDDSSSFLSETSEDASEEDKIRRASTRSIRFEDERGVLPKLYSTIVRKLTFNRGLPLKPALKNKYKASSSERVISDNGPNIEGETEVTAIGSPDIKDGSPPGDPSSSKAGPAAKSKPMSKGKGKGKATVANELKAEEATLPRWISVSGKTPASKVKPTYKGKGKGKAVLLEGAPDDVSAQIDGPALEHDSATEDDCAIEDSPTEQEAPATSGSRTPSLELLRDRSDQATSGSPWGLLRTESPERRPARYAHPKTPDRTFPIQPIPPVKSFTYRPDFTIRHFPPSTAGSSAAGPSSSRAPTVGAATSVSARYQLLVGKRLVQESVKSQLGIKKIPSPTIRPTKSMMDTAIGFLYSDKDRRNPREGDDSLGDSLD